MTTSRKSLLALCLFTLALPFCTSNTSQTSQVKELAEFRGQNLRASTGRRLLQATKLVYAVFSGNADGGLTLGSITVAGTQVVASSKTVFASDLASNYLDPFASNIAQTGCSVVQVLGTGSASTSYVAFLNLTHVQPPNQYQDQTTKRRIYYDSFSKYLVDRTLSVGRPAKSFQILNPYSIVPVTFNDDKFAQTLNVTATFRPVGKACSSATFGNDGQQASPVVLKVVGNILSPTSGGSLRKVLLTNATCISIRIEILNAPFVDQLNTTVTLNLTAFARMGVTGALLNQTLTSLKLSYAASNIQSTYSGSLNNLDPNTVYAISISGSGPTKNAVTLSVYVAMLTRNGTNCGSQLTQNLSLAQPPSGK